MPIYKVKLEGNPPVETLVQAANKNAAMNHLIKGRVTAENLTPDQVADEMAAGAKVEKATPIPENTEPEKGA